MGDGDMVYGVMVLWYDEMVYGDDQVDALVSPVGVVEGEIGVEWK